MRDFRGGGCCRTNQTKEIYADKVYYPTENGEFYQVASMPDVTDFLLVEKNKDCGVYLEVCEEGGYVLTKSA